MIANANFGISTDSCISECVPIMRSTCPDFIEALISFLFFSGMLPIKSPILMSLPVPFILIFVRCPFSLLSAFSELSKFKTVDKCCSASTSVGAINAD